MEYPVKTGKKGSDGTWTWETKVQVATALKVTGNQRLVSQKSKVPYDTINLWKKEDWFVQLMQELKFADRAELNTKLGSIVNKSIDIVEDRLDHGDYILDQKTGQIRRKPVNMKDAAKVVNDFVTQQLKIQEQELTQEQEKETIQDTLRMLAQEFSKLNRTAKKNNATDISYVEVLNAIHEEREEGLQTGSPTLHEQTRSNQETD
jgi:hypothetical protein